MVRDFVKFGAQVEVTNSTHNTGLNTFEERSQSGILVGYTDDSLMQAKVFKKGSRGQFGNLPDLDDQGAELCIHPR
jgi:hypothetical protein